MKELVMPAAAELQRFCAWLKKKLDVPFIFFFWSSHLFNPKAIARLYKHYNFEFINNQPP